MNINSKTIYLRKSEESRLTILYQIQEQHPFLFCHGKTNQEETSKRDMNG
jgi:hypothetical protein